MALSAGAQTLASTEGENVQEVIVTGYADRQLLLDARTETGSRLGLTARETPATIDILSQRQLQELGARTNVEALNRAPGVTSSLPATSPGVPTMRGFSGGAVGLLHDGVRVATPGIFSRSTDSFLYERIEILKGPAGVMYGEGALAGAINFVPKKPRFGSYQGSGVVSYGSFETSRIGLDINLPTGKTSALRGVATYGQSDGYVDDNHSRFLATTLAFSARPTDRLSLDVALDYSEDAYETADYGIPLVPSSVARKPSDIVSTPNGYVIDEALRDTNFNVTDGVLDAKTTWFRTDTSYRVTDAITLNNQFSAYQSDRNFINAEIFSFAPSTGMVDRTTGIITHDIDYWVERPSLNADTQIGSRRNRLTVGVEASELTFHTRRYFSTTTSVDPYTPVRGTFPGGTGNLPPTNSHATVKVASLFAEDAFNLSDRWLLVGGARYDWIEFDRKIEPTTFIDRKYKALSWRIGTVYDLKPKTQLFAQYSSAVAPVGNFLLLSLANSKFNLTTGEALEGGIKSSFWNDRIDLTLAAYHIRQNDIITRDPNNPTLSIQGGRQSSQGVELSMSAAVTSRLRIDGNFTRLDARYDELTEAGGISRRGKTPPRVAETIANLFGFYTFDTLPLTVNAGLRHAGDFYTDNANTIRVKGYTTVDAGISWNASFGTLTLRGRNLTDEFYADFSDVSTTQFQIAAPRSFDLTLVRKF